MITAAICSIIVSISINKPIKIAMKASPIESVRMTAISNIKISTQEKNRKLTPISLGIMNFKREQKKCMEHCYIIKPWRNHPVNSIFNFTFTVARKDGTTLFW